MVPVCLTTSESLEQIERSLGRLGRQLNELGLSMSVWTPDGQMAGQLQGGCPFCRLVCQASGHCREAHASMAREVLNQGAAATSVHPNGCCILGVPIYQRRRLRAVVVAGFPATDKLNDETLANVAESTGLDLEQLRRTASQCDHVSQEADNLLKVLTWLIESNQAIDTADGEIGALTANLARTYEELSLVYRISGAMQLTQKPGDFLEGICRELLGVMGVDAAAAIVHPHPSSLGEEDLVVLCGEAPISKEQLAGVIAEQIEPRLANSRGPVLENHFSHSLGQESDGGLRNYVAVELTGGGPIGLLVALNKQEGDFDSFDLKLISAIGNQAGVFLANSRLYVDLQDLLMGVLHALTATIDAKDPYTAGHSQRVALLSRRLAIECGYPPEKVQQIYLAGLLHDIGKIGVPESTLCKKGKLTPQEYEQMKRHPAIGAAILGGIRQLETVILYILTHHERPDGKGYPRGLKGDQIPKGGLIVGLADSFDAMTTHRTYRKALSLKAVTEEIKRCAGTQFDEDLVRKVLSIGPAELLNIAHEADTVAASEILSWQSLPQASDQ